MEAYDPALDLHAPRCPESVFDGVDVRSTTNAVIMIARNGRLVQRTTVRRGET